MKISFLYGVRLDKLIILSVKHGGIAFSRIPSYIIHVIYGIITLFFSIPDLFWKDKGLPKDITFIIGHYRSGTSHLLNLLTEEGTYTSPSNYQCLFPHTFLSTEFLFAPLLNKIAPKKRPMDNMTMVMESPQEEEIALAAMGASTPYLSIHFPKSADYFRNLISFKNADIKDIESWQKSHKKFLKKLAKRHGPDKPILLKSPTNTARIRLLLGMYPNAKFVHIHRDPYKTIQSSIHLYQVWYEMEHFQSLYEVKRILNKTVLDVYEEISRGWIEDRQFINEDRRISISFEELQSDPIDTLKKIYHRFDNTLDIKSSQKYLDTIKSYKKNIYNDLSNELVDEIDSRFDFIFEDQGYPKGLSL